MPEKKKKPMTMEQARKMVAGQLKSPSAIGKALRELMAGGPGATQTTIPEAAEQGQEPWPFDNPDTTEERKALGIPPRPDPENEDTEGW